MASRPQRLSRKGADFIARREGVVPYAYNDSRNNATFGIGHLLHLGPVTARDRLLYGTPQFPRRALANRLFRRDVRKYGNTVHVAMNRHVDQHRFDAMTSLCVNIGQGGFAGSTVAREAREGHFQAAGDAFLRWDKPPELLGRRKLERDLYLNGTYA